MQKTLLVTGGAGYIGSHAAVAFAQAGYKVVILDNFANSGRENLDGIAKILGHEVDFFECDITNRGALELIFEKYNFDGVLHFAGLKAVGESCKKIGEYHEKNIFGSIVLFDVMEKFGVKKIIFSSSATVYSQKNFPPFTENMPTGTTNPYGTSKFVIEKLIEDYVAHKNWQATSLRYFNPIGAHPSGFIGEIPRGVPNNLLPYIFDVARGKREKVRVFGDDYPTQDGSGVRDYIDINDLVDAHLLAYEHLQNGHEIFNVGTGKGTSVFEMIALVEKISDQKIPYEVISRRSGDLAIVFASAQKITDKLGWKAKNSVEDAIVSGWNFIQKIHHDS